MTSYILPSCVILIHGLIYLFSNQLIVNCHKSLSRLSKETTRTLISDGLESLSIKSYSVIDPRSNISSQLVSLKLHTLNFLEIPKNRLFSGVPLVFTSNDPGNWNSSVSLKSRWRRLVARRGNHRNLIWLKFWRWFSCDGTKPTKSLTVLNCNHSRNFLPNHCSLKET